MSPRRSSEVQFGSDAFLDVVCNIVGILIILIVIAGVRVSRAPLRTWLTTAVVVTQPPPTRETSGADEPDAPSPFELVAAEEAATDTQPPHREAAPSPADDLPAIRAQISAVDAEQHQATQALRTTQEQLTQAHEREAMLTERVAVLRQAVEQAEMHLQQTQQLAANTTAEISMLKRLATQLADEVQEAELVPTTAKRLEHRITPIGKTVTGKEVHFRLERQQVSVIPLERLLLRLREQIERRKDWLVKARQSEGEVGPIEGYTLRFVVQRDQLSAVEELRYGTGIYRISVAQWELQLHHDVVSEPVETALRPGSRFYQALLEADNDTTLTFWVYPDSFAAFRQLKAYCHEQNFLVAGRPMPPGMPIAGSPHGTRSSGQ
uniref:Uncharacterized protein n=1 Tax=Schlesneria paludicola TaxID=360056 RepID=A0A7C4LSN0_9PLAN